MNKPTFDFDKIGKGRLSVYLPISTETSRLRTELRRTVGGPSAAYSDKHGRFAEEWLINNGRAMYGVLSTKVSWQVVFSPKLEQINKEFDPILDKGRAI